MINGHPVAIAASVIIMYCITLQIIRTCLLLTRRGSAITVLRKFYQPNLRSMVCYSLLNLWVYITDSFCVTYCFHVVYASTSSRFPVH